ncbi:uncharacterized protein LOC109850269 [Asparagus officinalis]|uniref:uncharacterized protein LOC109850269 n=1 Tax=Asparagus officinalis TaxID=4686 RepID=UPI00098E86EC|nr:uncharacterized protein LOC109850269 [Asparagus officinalis]
MAGVYSCLAPSPISFPLLAPLSMAGVNSCVLPLSLACVLYLSPLPFKPTTKNSRLNACFLPATSRFHHGVDGARRYPCLRVSTKLPRRVEPAVPLKILRAKPKCCPVHVNNPNSEFINNISSGEDDNQSWISRVEKTARDFLEPKRERWVVPWGMGTVFLFFNLCFAWNKLHGHKIFPLIDRVDPAYHDPLWLLSTQPIQIAILYLCLYRFRPLPTDCLHFSIEGNWLFDLIIACRLFPLVGHIDSISHHFLGPTPVDYFSSFEQAIKFRDYPAAVLGVLAGTVCAPICEEIVFRGFLMPWLSRHMHPFWSILLSSLCFAEIHHDPVCMPSHTAFGIIMAVVFSRSRNLLPPVLLHSMWNMFCYVRQIQYLTGIYWKSSWHA